MNDDTNFMACILFYVLLQPKPEISISGAQGQSAPLRVAVVDLFRAKSIAGWTSEYLEVRHEADFQLVMGFLLEGSDLEECPLKEKRVRFELRPGSEGSSIFMPYYNTYTHADPEDDVDADEREELDPA